MALKLYFTGAVLVLLSFGSEVECADCCPWFVSQVARKSALELITSYGYPHEAHFVTTQDGYVIEIHRIPSERGKASGLPVYVQHGILSSSDQWLLNERNSSLGFLLADEGYDVWLGNFRGNVYGRKHKTLSPNDSKFWKITADDHIDYDVRDIIDYILKYTDAPKLRYIGHSMGTIAAVGLLASQPEYNQKIESMHLMAPAIYFDNMKSFAKYALLFFTGSEAPIQWLMTREIMTPYNLLYRVIIKLCHLQPRVCITALFSSMGFDYDEINTSRVPLYLAHFLTGFSGLEGIHLAQLFRAGKLQRFDWGEIENMEKYNKPDPPQFNLSHVTVPVYIYYAKNDLLVDPKDARQLCNDLLDVRDCYKIKYDYFNHVDYQFAKDAHSMVYKRILKNLRNGRNNVTPI